MAKGISVGVGADTREFITGIQKGVIKPLEGVEDSLVDVARSGDKAGAKLETAFDGARKETSQFKKDQTELGKVMANASDSGGTAFRKNVKKGTDAGKESMDEFGRESNSTAKETAASFDGSADSIVGAFQEVAANAFAGFGPIGAAAGLAVAIGMGAAIAKGTEVAEAINDAKTRVGELALEIADAGGDISKVDLGAKIREWGVDIADSREWFELWQEDAVTNLEKASKAAKTFGVDAKDMVRGLSGSDSAAALRVVAQLQAKLDAAGDAAADAAKNTDDYSAAGDGAAAAFSELSAKINPVIDDLKRSAGITGDAADAAKLLAEMTAEETAATAAAEAATKAHDAALDIRNGKIAALQSGLDSAVGAFDSYKDAESGALDPGAYVANIQARIDATAAMASNVADLTTQYGLSHDEQQAILDLGLDFAPMLQSIRDNGLSGEFVAQIKSAVGGGQDALNASGLAAAVDVTADTDPAAGDLDDLTGEKRSTEVAVSARTSEASGALNHLARDRTATITADLSGASGIERQIDDLARNRTVRVTLQGYTQDGRLVI